MYVLVQMDSRYEDMLNEERQTLNGGRLKEIVAAE